MSSKPLWLDVVHRLERSIGERVESAVRTDTYFDAVTTATRATATIKSTAEAISRRALHLVNLPAGSDVRRLREQLSRMERRLNALSENVAELDDAPRQRSGVR
jgi:hypothetical protein